MVDIGDDFLEVEVHHIISGHLEKPKLLRLWRFLMRAMDSGLAGNGVLLRLKPIVIGYLLLQGSLDLGM